MGGHADIEDTERKERIVEIWLVTWNDWGENGMEDTD